MRNEEAIERLESWLKNLPKEIDYTVKETYEMAIKALRQTADNDCSQCRERGRCAIHDNFNIDYCSDWRLP